MTTQTEPDNGRVNIQVFAKTATDTAEHPFCL